MESRCCAGLVAQVVTGEYEPGDASVGRPGTLGQSDALVSLTQAIVFWDPKAKRWVQRNNKKVGPRRKHGVFGGHS